MVAALGLALLTPACNLIYPFNVDRTEDVSGDASPDQTVLPDLPRRDLITDSPAHEGAAPDQASSPPLRDEPR